MTELSFSFNHTDEASDSERMLEALEHLQPIRLMPNRVHYIYDLNQQKTVYGTGSVGALLGYSDAEIHAMGSQGLADLVHPDDLERVSVHYQKFETLRYGELISIRYRMKRTDGSWGWLASQETPLMPEEIGKAPSQILGMIENITKPAPLRSRLLSHFFKRRTSSSKCPYLAC